MKCLTDQIMYVLLRAIDGNASWQLESKLCGDTKLCTFPILVLNLAKLDELGYTWIVKNEFALSMENWINYVWKSTTHR